MTPRFFVDGAFAVGDAVALDGSDAHKIRDVLRMKSGDSIEIIDSAATRFRARLQIAERSLTAHLEELLAARSAPPISITVAQGVPKAQKMDFVVEKLTELGVSKIVPLLSERAIPRDIAPAKLERWRRLARSAAQQCGRAEIPSIEQPHAFDELVRSFRSYDTVLVPWELAPGEPLRDRLPPMIERARRILVAIGPEGGFSHREAEAAAQAGAHLISLGGRILRTETAGLVAVSMLGYALGI